MNQNQEMKMQLLKEFGITDDKITPKFKVGDIIKHNQKQWTIIDIDTENHCYDLTNDECVDIDTADNSFELVEQKKELKKIEQNNWSEEDEEMYKEVLTDIIYAKNDLEAKECLGLSKRAMEAFNWFSKRYKSLRPQKWKPSEEQMSAFKMVFDWYNNNFPKFKVLESLYNDLNKLK